MNISNPSLCHTTSTPPLSPLTAKDHPSNLIVSFLRHQSLQMQILEQHQSLQWESLYEKQQQQYLQLHEKGSEDRQQLEVHHYEEWQKLEREQLCEFNAQIQAIYTHQQQQHAFLAAALKPKVEQRPGGKPYSIWRDAAGQSPSPPF